MILTETTFKSEMKVRHFIVIFFGLYCESEFWLFVSFYVISVTFLGFSRVRVTISVPPWQCKHCELSLREEKKKSIYVL